MSNEEIKKWIIDPDSKYIVESHEEYTLINKRLEQLWSIVEDPNNLDDPDAMELTKLTDAVIHWEKYNWEEYDWVDEWVRARTPEVKG